MADYPPPSDPTGGMPPGGAPPPPGGYGQPAYGQPAYGAPGGYQQPAYGGGAAGPKTNLMAILSLCFGLGGIVTCGLTSLAAVPLGFVGLSQIKQSEGRETGRGLAIAGIVSGIVIIVVGIGIWIGLVVLADSADNIVDEICEDLDSDGDGINDCEDFDDFSSTTFTIPD
jgi:hypothetical protein